MGRNGTIHPLASNGSNGAFQRFQNLYDADHFWRAGQKISPFLAPLGLD